MAQKQYVDRFIRENYTKIEAKFRVLDGTLRSNGESTLDVLNDTMIGLYSVNTRFLCYDDFYRFAMNKFTEKDKRNKKPL